MAKDVYIHLKMLHYTAVFYFIFHSAQPMMYIKVEHFSPENLEYFTQNDRERIYMSYKVYINDRRHIYTSFKQVFIKRAGC